MRVQCCVQEAPHNEQTRSCILKREMTCRPIYSEPCRSTAGLRRLQEEASQNQELKVKTRQRPRFLKHVCSNLSSRSPMVPLPRYDLQEPERNAEYDQAIRREPIKHLPTRQDLAEAATSDLGCP